MNLILQRFVALMSTAMLLAMPVRGAVVAASYHSAAAVPVTLASYTATGNSVDFTLNFAPAVGTSLTVVNNTGLGFIQGTFDNLAQGQRVMLSFDGIRYGFVANYFGGSGNDLVLQWANKRLLGWGANSYGGLGNDSTTSSSVPVAVDMTGVLAGKMIASVVGGGSHSLALCTDGTLAAWGYNNGGQLGNGANSNSQVPVLVSCAGTLASKMIVAIAAGQNHSLALCADGSVVAWGYNDYGQLGNAGTTSSNVPVTVSASGVLAGKKVVAIAAGTFHSLALCADGTVATWGSNNSGQLGNGTTTQSNVPVVVNRTGVLADKTVVAMAGGGSHSLALCADGTVAAWGANTYGQLGNSTTTIAIVPDLVSRAGVLAGKAAVAIAAGGGQSLVLCADGTLAAWGDNGDGELGNNSTTHSSVPVLVDRTGVLAEKPWRPSPPDTSMVLPCARTEPLLLGVTIPTAS
jgi:alpha-tubulin suppressor-like RCC1 family protein